MLATLCAMSAAAVMTYAALLAPPGRVGDLLKAGAAIQFMNSMATLACGSVAQIGGLRARRAPPFFLTSVPLLSGAIYAAALGAPAEVWLLAAPGALAAGIGWVLLAWATTHVDDAPRTAVAPAAAE